MNDREVMEAMLKRAGVVYEVVQEDEVPRPDVEYIKEGDTTLTMHQGAGPRNGGYGYFLACLHFTPDGALRGVSAWE